MAMLEPATGWFKIVEVFPFKIKGVSKGNESYIYKHLQGL